MGIKSLHVKGYRSIRDIRLELKQLNVLTGPNGCGKSNLYQSMFLLHAAARGELARTVAEEGGTPSILWAGERDIKSVRMTLGVEVEELCFELQTGIVTYPGHATRTEPSYFGLDPEVKEESLSLAGNSRAFMMKRTGGLAWLRDVEGRRAEFPFDLNASESLLAQIRQPHLYPQLTVAAQELKSWRFYHHFRTDPDSQLRQPQVGVRTSVLARDGRDLAAALRTIYEVGDGGALAAAVEDAFQGAELKIHNLEGRFSVSMKMPGIFRPLQASELSDGTLRYLCLLAALLSPRPPSLLAFNEPETSLHPDLIQPLARLIAGASRYSQIWITTHSVELAEAIEKFSGQPRIQLEKLSGETRVVGQRLV